VDVHRKQFGVDRAGNGVSEAEWLMNRRLARVRTRALRPRVCLSFVCACVCARAAVLLIVCKGLCMVLSLWGKSACHRSAVPAASVQAFVGASVDTPTARGSSSSARPSMALPAVAAATPSASVSVRSAAAASSMRGKKSFSTGALDAAVTPLTASSALSRVSARRRHCSSTAVPWHSVC
jgi:hypothetical protein